MTRSKKMRHTRYKGYTKRRKTGKEHKVAKHYKKTHKRIKKRKRVMRKGQRGGSFTSKLDAIINAIPGGTDIRDFYWSSTNSLGNVWKTWNGFPNSPKTSVLHQPANTLAKNIEPRHNLDIAKIYNNAGDIASGKNFQAF